MIEYGIPGSTIIGKIIADILRFLSYLFGGE